MEILDTSVFIAAERGQVEAAARIARLLAADDLAVSVITVFELTSGPTTPPHLVAGYESLFAGKPWVLPVTFRVARLAAELARQAGSAAAAPDALIAGAAAAWGLTVVTADAGFLRFPGLRVEVIPAGPVAHEDVAGYVAPPPIPSAGARIRALRRASGRSASALAAAAGMARSNWARLESGRHDPGVRTLGRAAAALRVPLAALLG